MDNLDLDTFVQTVLKLGLVSPAQMAEAQEEALSEAGKGRADLAALLRVLERKRLLYPWQTGKVLKQDFGGLFLGGYRLLYKISSGSFGRVFRADDPRSGRVVAVKVLRRRWSEDKNRIDLFMREGRVGLTLKHQNIVEVLAVGQDTASGQYYLVMEFVEGGNLREILQIRKTLNVAESLRVIEDAASGLAYAYTRGVTHRDIKLTNLLIASTGEAKLVDFGLAQIFANVREDEKIDRTVDYAGLERATGVKTGDVRSDIYFLGTVLYECLTGKPPLTTTRDRHARMRKDRFEQAQHMSHDEIQAPPSVFALVETMMSLQPHRRYQTPSQLLDAIRAARRDLGGPKNEKAKSVRSLFIVEKDERLQDALRDKFKEMGFRVFMAGDPIRALDRFRQQPYDALVIDAGTTGEEGLVTFERVLLEANRQRVPCASILILSEDQADWAHRIAPAPSLAVLVRPVTLKQLKHKLEELLPHAEHDSSNGKKP